MDLYDKAVITGAVMGTAASWSIGDDVQHAFLVGGAAGAIVAGVGAYYTVPAANPYVIGVGGAIVAFLLAKTMMAYSLRKAFSEQHTA